MLSHSVMSDFWDPMDCSPPGSFAMEFSRQEYWNGLPFSLPGNLPDPGFEPVSPASPALQADSLLLSHLGIPLNIDINSLMITVVSFPHFRSQVFLVSFYYFGRGQGGSFDCIIDPLSVFSINAFIYWK